MGGGTGGTRGPNVDIRPVMPGAGGTVSAPPDAGVAPSPDGGSTEPPPCIDCETVRVSSGALTEFFGSPGGELYMEICPHDQVVVGMDYRFNFGSPADFGFLSSVSTVCGALVPTVSAGTVGIVVGEPLPPRGAGNGMAGIGGRCPAGQVVTGFEGARNFDGTTSELREITLHCAPVTLAGGALQIGAATPAPPLSANFALSTVPADVVLPLQPCPAGQLARGVAVHAGAWVDGVGLECGALSLARPDGQACTSASECQSGLCNVTCQPRVCQAPANCTCVLRENVQYAVCEGAQTQSAASELCAASGMHLAHAIDVVAHGWLRSTASDEGIQAEFWLGADDLVAEGVYQWVQGGGAVDLESALWDGNQLRGGTAENCLAMTRDGQWDDVDCALPLPFVCEAPSPAN
jgi:hypothetical protein